jgi:murein DD-endopeptidase MepM/ murein hydrolase activator NlpD
LSRRRRLEKLGDFGRGLSLAGAVAFSAFALVPLSPVPPAAGAVDLASILEERLDLPQASVPALHEHDRSAKVSAAPDRVATLGRGDTLGDLLSDLGLPGEEIPAVVRAASPHLNPRQLQPGLRIAAFVENDRPERFEVALAGRGDLTVLRTGAAWESSYRAYAREARTRTVRGTIAGSLERSLAAAGAETELAYAMADVLQWDLDFTRDLQNGDRFEALFEEIYLDGSFHSLGRVLALRYVQPRRTLEVFHYGDGDAYYDAEGRPLEKMFLRAPLPYSRVTSKFSTHRFHPVLKITRPHYGVDYGAPTGTPVRVTANGVVQSAGWDGGGGKTVKVRHANGFLTAYLHLSRFASGVSAGARVSQGEIVGYVGSTGLASGPHLDYRVQQNGRWIDPLSMKSVPAVALSSLARDEFLRERDAMRVALGGEAPFAAPAAHHSILVAGASPLTAGAAPPPAKK